VLGGSATAAAVKQNVPKKTCLLLLHSKKYSYYHYRHARQGALFLDEVCWAPPCPLLGWCRGGLLLLLYVVLLVLWWVLLLLLAVGGSGHERGGGLVLWGRTEHDGGLLTPGCHGHKGPLVVVPLGCPPPPRLPPHAHPPPHRGGLRGGKGAHHGGLLLELLLLGGRGASGGGRGSPRCSAAAGAAGGGGGGNGWGASRESGRCGGAPRAGVRVEGRVVVDAEER
jgi:hypothetical protein